MFTYKSLDHRKIPGFWHKKAPICENKYHTEFKKEMIRKRTSCEWRIEKIPRNSNLKCSKMCQNLACKALVKEKVSKVSVPSSPDVHALPVNRVHAADYMPFNTECSIPLYIEYLQVIHKKSKSKWYEIRKTVFSVCNKAWCSRIRLDRAKCSMFICQCSG